MGGAFFRDYLHAVFDGNVSVLNDDHAKAFTQAGIIKWLWYKLLKLGNLHGNVYLLSKINNKKCILSSLIDLFRFVITIS